jgi:hypothetical protein
LGDCKPVERKFVDFFADCPGTARKSPGEAARIRHFRPALAAWQRLERRPQRQWITRENTPVSFGVAFGATRAPNRNRIVA